MMAEPKIDLTKSFEQEVCGRCWGSGSYSYCQMYGTRCFGCGGSGVKLSKRGTAARLFFEESIKVPASDVQVGWLARGRSRKWYPVTEVEPYRLRGASLTDGVMVDYDRPGLCITFGKCGHVEGLDSMIEAQPNIEAVRAKIALALTYQQTLTKAALPALRGAAK